MDIALLYRKNRPVKADIELLGADLLTGRDLETAVIISLFSDRRAHLDDVIESDDRKGFWGDLFTVDTGYKIGSRLWLLFREKETPAVLARAREYTEEALQWLIDDRVVDRLTIEVEFVQRGILGIKVELYRPTGRETFQYDYVWDRI